MRKRKIFLLLILFFSLLFSSCSKVYDEEVIRKFADPMTENTLKSMSDKDYQNFIGNLGPKMTELVSESYFNDNLYPMINIIGQYESMEFAKVTEKNNYIVVIYIAKFSNEEDDVIVTISFTEDLENPKIEGLFLNSPKILKEYN